MQSDPLQQLRDIHLPPDPSWWPLAPGWWILACAAFLITLLGVRWLMKRWRAGAPKRQATALHKAAYGAYRSGSSSARAYADECNAILKRLFVHAQGKRHLASANEVDWLCFLDETAQTDEFTTGVGTILGNDRFRPNATVDGEALHALMNRILKAAS